MRLTTSAGAEIANPTAQDVAQALGELPLTLEYEAVLAIDRDHFIQARTEPGNEGEEGNGEGIMVHALDGAKHMFESTTRHPSATVTRLFQLYAQGNPQWKQEIAWKEFTSIGSRLWIIAAVIVGMFVVFQLLSRVLFRASP
jgi:hypothetical protein